MKWKATPCPQYDDTRTVKHFAFLPELLITSSEWVWLEWYYTDEVYTRIVGWYVRKSYQ